MKHILIVDDHPSIPEMLTWILQSSLRRNLLPPSLVPAGEELSFVTAVNYTEAQAAIESHLKQDLVFALALVDGQFPQGNGPQLIALLQEKMPPTICIGMTGSLETWKRDVDVVNARAEICTPLAKPFGAVELRKGIYAAVARAQPPI